MFNHSIAQAKRLIVLMTCCSLYACSGSTSPPALQDTDTAAVSLGAISRLQPQSSSTG